MGLLSKVVLEVSCDKCNSSHSVCSQQTFEASGLSRAKWEARYFGWVLGKKTLCPDCSGKKVSDEVAAYWELQKHRFEREEKGLATYQVWDNSEGSQSCDTEHCETCRDAEILFAIENHQPVVDLCCSDCILHGAVVEVEGRFIKVGSEDWVKFLNEEIIKGEPTC